MIRLLDIPAGWYPRFSPDGLHVCFGFGKVGVAEARAGGAVRWYASPPGQQLFQGGWLNDVEVAVLTDPAPYSMLALDIRTGAFRMVHPDYRASSFEASFGHYASTLSGGGFPVTWDGALVAAGLPRHSGARVWKDRFITAVDPGGDPPRWKLELRMGGELVASFLPTVGQTNEMRLGEGWASWGYFGIPYATPLANFGGEIHSVAVVPGSLPSGEGPAFPFVVDGATWIVTGGEMGDDLFMAVRPILEQAVVKVPWPGIKPEGIQRGADIIVAGESDKGHLQVWQFPVSTPRARLVAPAPPPHVDPLDKRCWAGWAYAWSHRYGSDPSAPQNCTLVVEPGLDPPGPVVISRLDDHDGTRDLIAEWAARWSRVIAIFVSNEGHPLQGEIDKATAQMDARKLPRKPFVTYTAGDVLAATAARFDGWVGIECYQYRETLPEAEHRWRNDMQTALPRLNGRGIALWGGATDRGYLTDAQLKAAMSRYPELLRSAAPATMLLWFAWGRPQGGKQHHLEDWAKATVDATSPPAIPPGKPKPPDPEPPPMDTTLGLRTWQNKYITAENGGDDKGVLHAIDRYDEHGKPKPQQVNAWETFVLVDRRDVGEGLVNIRTSGGRYWCAEGGGGSVVVANRTTPAGWELFRKFANGDGTLSFRSHDGGKFVACETNGDITCTRIDIGPWEKFAPAQPGETYTPAEPPKPVDPNAPGRKGRTRSEGRHFADDGGRYYPFGATLLWAGWGWRRDRDRYKANAQWAKDHGADYVRFLAEVDWANDHGCAPGPWVGEVIDFHASIGLKSQVTVGGGRGQNLQGLVDATLPFLRPRVEQLHLVELVNEYYALGYGQGEVLAAANRLRAGLPLTLVAPSNSNAAVPADENKMWGYPVGLLHSERGDGHPDGKWYMVRKPWDSGEPDRASSNNEPPGPLSSVATLNEAIHCACLRAYGLICGWEDFVLHNAAGVMGVVDPTHHRPANLWEANDIERVMDAAHGVASLIPSWCSDGARSRGGSTGDVGPHPLGADSYWPAGGDHGVVRDYARTSPDGNEFVQLLSGVKGHVGLEAKRRNWKLTFTDVVTRQVMKSTTLNLGSRMDIGQSPSVDSDHKGAWLVRGTAA